MTAPVVLHAPVLLHALADLLLVAVLVGFAYRRSSRDTGTAFALGVLNLGLFATLVAVSGDAFTTGAGFGLFGMLSLIRLRSASFTTVDMGYAFVALVVGLVLGLVDVPLATSGTLAAALVLAVIVGERLRRGDVVRVTLILDVAHRGTDHARADVEARLRTPVLDVTVLEVDFVKETTTVTAVLAPAGDVRPERPAGPAIHVPARVVPAQGIPGDARVAVVAEQARP